MSREEEERRFDGGDFSRSPMLGILKLFFAHEVAKLRFL